jgi:hypothetical protein
LIIGAQKAGTTWLAKCLGEHPDIFIPEIKELYYFDRYYEKGLPWYESQFAHWSGEKAVGEGSVSYIRSTRAPDRIRAALGQDVKLIASLRHPVERAYSAYRMYLSRGMIPYEMDFATFVQEDVLASRDQGLYSPQVSLYQETFAPENMHILIYEEIWPDSQAAVSKCAEFLDVDPDFAPPSLKRRVNPNVDVSVMHNQVWGLRRAIKGLPAAIEKPLLQIGRRIFEYLPKRRSYEPLTAETKRELLEPFMADIRTLESLLERDLSVWYAPKPTSERDHALMQG